MNSHILNVYQRSSISITRGNGAYLYDADGKMYLDFAAGIATVNLGHCNQRIIDALQHQSKKLWHCANLFAIPEQQKLAEKLVNLTFADKVFFCSSGLEATESAIKFIRRYNYINGQKQRNNIITIRGGFHGRSITAISAGGNDYVQEGFKPLLQGFTHVERNNITALKQAINNTTAGIFLELVQSEGGVYPLDLEYLHEIKKITEKEKILLAFDEVQTGYGRTGSLFYHQKIGITPDILNCAKAMGNGFPLAGCLMTNKVAEVMKPGTHGSTYGGNPLAMSVGNAVLDTMTENEFFNKIQESISYLHKALNTIQEQFSYHIKEIRKVGMLIGVEFHPHISTRQLIIKCIENGLIITKTANINTIRLAPPIVITKNEIDVFTEVFTTTLQNSELMEAEI